MKCNKCGKLNDDKYIFCTNCGQKILEFKNNNILFEFKPTYVFKYRFLNSVLFWFSLFSIPIIIIILFNFYFEFIDYIFYIALIIYFPYILFLIFLIINNIVDYNKYKNTNVEVYKDRLIIITSFINRIEKEILFTDISSLTIFQNGGQKKYNLGNIGITIDELKNFDSYILLKDIQNVGLIYQKLKNLKDSDKNEM